MEKNIKLKNSLIELLRFIAVCDVVSFHTLAPWSKYTGGAIEIFTIITFSFLLNSKQSFSNQLKKNFKRLILPWIFWSVMYGIVLIIKSIKNGTPISNNFNWLMLLSGTNTPLWYLPFIFVSSTIVFFIVKHFNVKLNNKVSYIIAILAGLFLIIVSILLLRFNIMYPFAQWLWLTPAIIIAFIFSLFYYKLTELIFKYGLWFVIICCIGTLMIDMRFGLSYLLVVCVLALTFSYKPQKSNIYLNYLGKISFGIYLIHPFSTEFLYYVGIGPKNHWFTFLTIILTIVVTSILEKTVIKRFI